MTMDRSIDVAVVGATGTVGRELLAALQDSGHPGERVTALASERSEGREVDYGGETLEVERATPEALRGRRLVLLAVPPDVARPLAQAAQAQGAWAVDVSRAFAGDAGVPVVLPAVNGVRLKEPFPGRIVRTPSPVATALLTALEPLRTAFGLRQGVVTALLGASSAGVRGVKALESQTAALLSGREFEEGPFPHRLAFNVIPQVGAFQGPSTDEETGWREDATRVWGEGSAARALGGLALQVPHFFGHCVAVAFQLERDASLEALHEAWRKSPALKLLDAPADRTCPMPLLATSDPSVLVGRLQALASAPGWWSAFLVVDNAGRGAALNALEVAQALLARS
jgi:aspartate-semialdehyde dehydrogenase